MNSTTKFKKAEFLLRVRLNAKHERLLNTLCERLDLDRSKTMRLALRELAKRNKIQ